MTPDDCIKAAQELAPLIREKARETEIERRPLDEVIDAARESGLFSMMVPRRYSGHEFDIDAFFEVVVVLSESPTGSRDAGSEPCWSAATRSDAVIIRCAPSLSQQTCQPLLHLGHDSMFSH